MRILPLLLLFLIPVLSSMGQTPVAGGGQITVHQSSQISAMLEKHREINAKFRGYPGFRIQIYFGNGNKAKEEALRIRKQFSEDFLDYETYILFQTPYFKVRVGDFVNRYDAYLAFQEISKKYPQAFLVEDLVTPLKK